MTKSDETIFEHVNRLSYTKLWLCPSLVSDGKISRSSVMQGLDCTPSSIPKELYNKRVRKVFNDGQTHCIIWENEDDHSFLNINGLLGNQVN